MMTGTTGNAHVDMYNRELQEGDLVAVCFSNRPYVGIITEIRSRREHRLTAQVAIIDRGWRQTDPFRVRRQTKRFGRDIIKVAESSLDPATYALLLRQAGM